MENMETLQGRLQGAIRLYKGQSFMDLGIIVSESNCRKIGDPLQTL